MKNIFKFLVSDGYVDTAIVVIGLIVLYNAAIHSPPSSCDTNDDYSYDY